jgi:aspartate kinase
MRIVVKFGGTSIATPQLVVQAAASIKRLLQGNEVAVVVSAMGGTTSELVKLIKGLGKKTSDLWEASGVIGMGEVISARLMALALRRDGVRAMAITPDMEAWPVLASAIGDRKLEEDKINQEPLATIDLVKTTQMCTKTILPLLEERKVPVLCGFLARDELGRTIAIGRGGSDISAVALGKCLDADRIIIVTDVPGVLKADPRAIPATKPVGKISVGEIESLSRGGARVIHPSSLQYKMPGQKLFIVDYKSKNFLRGGTEIVGTRNARIFRTKGSLACITVVGKGFIRTHGLMNLIAGRLSRLQVSIYGVSASENYIGVYVKENLAERASKEIYDLVESVPKFRAFSVKRGIGRMRLSSEAFIEQPGIIGRIGDILAMKSINIIEMVTIQSDITIFLNVKDLNRAYILLKRFSF